MFLTIIVVPMMYYIVDRLKEKLNFRKKKNLDDDVLIGSTEGIS
jgi:hypothetical protein